MLFFADEAADVLVRSVVKLGGSFAENVDENVGAKGSIVIDIADMYLK